MGAMKRRTLLGLLLLVGAAACYLAIVVARQGPPPGGDTTPLTDVTSALASDNCTSPPLTTDCPTRPATPS